MTYQTYFFFLFFARTLYTFGDLSGISTGMALRFCCGIRKSSDCFWPESGSS